MRIDHSFVRYGLNERVKNFMLFNEQSRFFP
jgi:hypothetical protein